MVLQILCLELGGLKLVVRNTANMLLLSDHVLQIHKVLSDTLLWKRMFIFQHLILMLTGVYC